MKGRLGCPINHLSKKQTALAVEWQMEQLLYRWGGCLSCQKYIEERRNYVNPPIFSVASIYIYGYMNTCVCTHTYTQGALMWAYVSLEFLVLGT